IRCPVPSVFTSGNLAGISQGLSRSSPTAPAEDCHTEFRDSPSSWHSCPSPLAKCALGLYHSIGLRLTRPVLVVVLSFGVSGCNLVAPTDPSPSGLPSPGLLSLITLLRSASGSVPLFVGAPTGSVLSGFLSVSSMTSNSLLLNAPCFF